MTPSPPAFVDLHSDYPLDVTRRRRMGEGHVLRDRRLPLQRAANTALEVMTVATDHRFHMGGGALDMGDLATVHEIVDHVRCELDDPESGHALVLDAADLDRCIERGDVGVVLNLEGVGCLRGDLAAWRNLHRLGVRALSLTHDPRNEMADGCREQDGGLSRLGRRFVRELNGYDVVFDLVHAGERSFFGALEEYEGPVVVTHAGAHALCETPRNLSDDQIRAVGERGGVVGVIFASQLLRGDGVVATADDVVRHIEHVAVLIGLEGVALGPDWIDYMDDFLPDTIANMGYDPAILKWADGLEGLHEIASLPEALARHGYADVDIAAICGGNALRAVRRCLGGAA